MAGNAYSDEVLGATNWLKEKSNQEVFSFVFKNENVQLNGKDIGWNSYRKDLQDDELKSLVRGAETTFDQSEDMEWESALDETTKKFSTLTISDSANPEHWRGWFHSLPRCSTEPNLGRDRSRLESLLQSRTVGERLQRGADLGLRYDGASS
uniref:Nonstructural protein NS2Y n=1 Tax=Tumor virus X TaxID=1507809 RepID=A0A068B6Z9_9VIRU|nr:nonstructural protein NS2Y [Tumor virus X]